MRLSHSTAAAAHRAVPTTLVVGVRAGGRGQRGRRISPLQPRRQARRAGPPGDDWRMLHRALEADAKFSRTRTYRGASYPEGGDLVAAKAQFAAACEASAQRPGLGRKRLPRRRSGRGAPSSTSPTRRPAPLRASPCPFSGRCDARTRPPR
ncbi:hypothetical protein M885DRAFT_545809, partial [Pelagophyceae sp. CCMP2097]